MANDIDGSFNLVSNQPLTDILNNFPLPDRLVRGIASTHKGPTSWHLMRNPSNWSRSWRDCRRVPALSNPLRDLRRLPQRTSRTETLYHPNLICRRRGHAPRRPIPNECTMLLQTGLNKQLDSTGYLNLCLLLAKYEVMHVIKRSSTHCWAIPNDSIHLYDAEIALTEVMKSLEVWIDDQQPHKQNPEASCKASRNERERRQARYITWPERSTAQS